MTAGAGHLVHGMGLALEAPAWPVITRAEAAAILPHFPRAGRLIGLTWHSPRPFSSATLMTTSQGEFVLKRHHHTLRDAEGLAQEHRFIAHLHAAGLSVPKVMAADDDSGTVAQGAWTYELHRKAPGADLYRDATSWTPFASYDQAHAAGAALARLHVAAQGFDAPMRPPQPLVSSFTIVPAPDPTVAAAAYVAARPGLAAFLADRPWQNDLAPLFEALGQGLSERLAHQPALWTHNDWHPSNLLWSDHGDVSTVFDFGLADRGCALHDLATAIERCAIAWLQMSASRDNAIGDPATALALIAGYRTVLPLTPDDIETVARLLPLVHVEFAMSEIDYFAGILADPEQAAQAWDDYVIGHAQWFHSRAGRDFLRSLTA
jgi:Ser/Thr protein kinase RdoA (MazF antagonist)